MGYCFDLSGLFSAVGDSFAKCIASLLHYYTCKTSWPLGCDSTFALAVATLSAPATITTHSRVIRLRRVLTDLPPCGSSIGPASEAV